MALFMDIHGHIAGLPADVVAQPRTAELKLQVQYGVTYLRDWFGETASKVFCRVDAPDKDVTITVHWEAQ